PLATKDQAGAKEIEERLPHGPSEDGIKGEAGSRPIAATPQLAQLPQDSRLILVFPLPDALDQFLAAQVVTTLVFLFAEPALHDRLRTDAGMIRAGNPQRVVALHAP